MGPRPLRADDGTRTRDPHLGKVMLYQLSHVRIACSRFPSAKRGDHNSELARAAQIRCSAPPQRPWRRPRPVAGSRPTDPAPRDHPGPSRRPPPDSGRSTTGTLGLGHGRSRRPGAPRRRIRTTRPPREQTARICPGTARCASFGQARAIGAAVARFVHTEEVTGSNPVSPTEIPFHLLTGWPGSRMCGPTESADPCPRRRKQLDDRASGATTGQTEPGRPTLTDSGRATATPPRPAEKCCSSGPQSGPTEDSSASTAS